MGPSTGTVVLSHLEGDDRIARIDVFGMNWRGRLPHNDFRDHTLVARCCRKCIVHPTPDLDYGAEWGTMQLMTILVSAMVSFVTFVTLLVLHQYCTRRREHEDVKRDDASRVAQKGLEQHSRIHLLS